jgi:hypothetical protein
LRNFPTLDPVVVAEGSFYVDRLLDGKGRVEVGVGDTVAPGDVIARTGNIDKSFTLYLANELDVPNDSLKKYLSKTIGSAVSEGETIARVRRGLRTAAVRSPATGTVVHVDDTDGTVTLTASTGPRELNALVPGIVEQVHPDRGITIRTQGSRVYGIVGFGEEAVGPLVIGSDRHDRELTADQVSKDWAGAIVLAGMTVGVPALTRMRDFGVAGVIVGSISEGDVRRFVSSDHSNDPSAYWIHQDLSASGRGGSPLVVIVTEGFGRLPMAAPVYDFLVSKSGANLFVSAKTVLGAQLARPEIYIEDSGQHEFVSTVAEPAVGRFVRAVDSQHLGSTGTIQSEVLTHSTSNGISREYLRIGFDHDDGELVPVENVEVLV